MKRGSTLLEYAGSSTNSYQYTIHNLSPSVLHHSAFIFFVHFLAVDLAPETLMSVCFQKFGLDTNTTDFIGHALALHRDDEYDSD